MSTDDIQYLIRRKFPQVDLRLYDTFKKTGTTHSPQPLTLAQKTEMKRGVKGAMDETLAKVKAYEDELLGQSGSEAQSIAEACRLADRRIDAIINIEFPEWKDINPIRAKIMIAMQVPGHGSGAPAANSSSKIDPITQKRIVEEVEARKAQLLRLTPEEISAIHKTRMAEDLRKRCCTIEETPTIIAARIYPDDGLEWTGDERKECEQEYSAHIKPAIISGVVPVINQTTGQPIDPSRLSDNRFPKDGLIFKSDLYRCLLPKHQGKGYFPMPAKAISNAPAPIKPLEGRPIDYKELARSYKFTEPDWGKWCKPGTNCRLWEGACLAANIEPPIGSTGKEICMESELETFPQNFKALWWAVNRDADFSRRFPLIPSSGRMLGTLQVSEFAAWALRKGFDIPERLKLTCQETTTLPPAAEKQAPLAETNTALSITPDTREDAGIRPTTYKNPNASYWVSMEEIMEHFKVREDFFKESANKFKWLKDARLDGKRGNGGYPPKYDPYHFAVNVPGMSYVPTWMTKEKAIQILKEKFPGRYEDMRHMLEPDD